MVFIEKGSTKAGFFVGQMVSLSDGKREFVHGGGKNEDEKDKFDKLGWGFSEILMFPYVGQVHNYKVSLEGKSYPMDQHGISRLLPFFQESHTVDSITFRQKYEGGQSLENPKHNKNPSHPEFLSWPYSFEITKKYTVREKGIDFLATIYAKEKFSYAFGWHPAFRAEGNEKKLFFDINNTKISYNEMQKASESQGAYIIPLANAISYLDQENKTGLKFQTNAFNHIMLWSPSSKAKMFCVEPVSVLPDGHLKDYAVLLGGEKKEFETKISFLEL